MGRGTLHTPAHDDIPNGHMIRMIWLVSVAETTGGSGMIWHSTERGNRRMNTPRVIIFPRTKCTFNLLENSEDTSSSCCVYSFFYSEFCSKGLLWPYLCFLYVSNFFCLTDILGFFLLNILILGDAGIVQFQNYIIVWGIIHIYQCLNMHLVKCSDTVSTDHLLTVHSLFHLGFHYNKQTVEFLSH